MTREPRRDRPDNLDAPLPGDRGAHGRFDDRARGRSAQQWLFRHRLAAAGALVVSAALVVRAAARRR